jgi:hypothetical protein
MMDFTPFQPLVSRNSTSSPPSSSSSLTSSHTSNHRLSPAIPLPSPATLLQFGAFLPLPWLLSELLSRMRVP